MGLRTKFREWQVRHAERQKQKLGRKIAHCAHLLQSVVHPNDKYDAFGELELLAKKGKDISAAIPALQDAWVSQDFNETLLGAKKVLNLLMSIPGHNNSDTFAFAITQIQNQPANCQHVLKALNDVVSLPSFREHTDAAEPVILELFQKDIPGDVLVRAAYFLATYYEHADDWRKRQIIAAVQGKLADSSFIEHVNDNSKYYEDVITVLAKMLEEIRKTEPDMRVPFWLADF